MDWVQWIVAGTALYGAVLATAQQVSKRRATSPRIVVRTSNGFPVFGRTVGDPSILVEAANKGQVSVVVSSFGLRLPDGGTAVLLHSLTPSVLPTELRPGQGHTVCGPMHDLALTLAERGMTGQVKLVGFCRTQVDDEYRSKPFTFDVDEWSRSAA